MKQKKQQPFFDKLLNQKPKFHHFGAMEIENIMIKTKIIVEEERRKVNNELRHYAKVLYSTDRVADQYINLQEVCARLLEIKCNKLILMYIDRVIDHKNSLADADGLVHSVPEQTLWLQNIAWYLSGKGPGKADQYLNFCYQYFKGVSITEDSTLESKMASQVISCKLKPNQIRFSTLKDWLEFCLEELTAERLNALIQLNEMFITNGFSNQQIRDYLQNPTEYMHKTRSHLKPPTSTENKQDQMPKQPDVYELGRDVGGGQTSFSQMKEVRKNQDTYVPAQTEISVQEKYSLMIIRKYLDLSDKERNYVITVEPFQGVN